MAKVPTQRKTAADPLSSQIESLGGKVVHSGGSMMENLIDEADQEKIVADLQSSIESQNRWSRWPLLGIFVGLGIFTCWRACDTYAHPTGALAWQSRVQEPLSLGAGVATFVCQAGAFLCAGVIVYGPVDELVADLAKVMGTLLAAVPLFLWTLWTGILFDAMLPRIMMWIPVSGPIAVMLAWYIDSDMIRLKEDLADLDKMRYAFKDV